jgi:5-methylcytosine-specific restriction endonuclease McrA
MAARVSSHVRYGKDWRRLRELVFRVKGRTCHWCGGPATTIDHVIPRVLGGAHELSNLVPSCARDN